MSEHRGSLCGVRRAAMSAIFGAAVLCAAAPCAMAQGAAQDVQLQPQRQEARRYFTQAGTWELGGSAGFSSNTPVANGATGDALTMITAMPMAGYFVAEGLEVFVNPLSVIYSSQGGFSDLELLTMGGVGYNYRAHPRVIPFIEGMAGYAHSRIESGTVVSRGGLAWGGRGGVKVLVTPGTLLTFGGSYMQVTLNPSGATERNGYNTIAVNIGLSFWL